MEDRESIESWCTSVLESLNLFEIEPKLDYLQITEMENNSTEPSRDKPFMATLKVIDFYYVNNSEFEYLTVVLLTENNYTEL